MNRLDACITPMSDALDKLIVILGAGASYNCVELPSKAFPAPRLPLSPITEVDEGFRPPLTVDLFEPKPKFNEILDRYPKVASLSEEIRARIRKEESLEKILREMSEISSFQTKKHVLEISLYLQELFWTISDSFIKSGRSKFSTLVRRVLDSPFEKVMFLTLNYDLFLERALHEYDDYEFVDIESYVQYTKKWRLVKAHGSVNWGKVLLNGPKFDGDFQTFLARVQAQPLFSHEIHLLSGLNKDPRYNPQCRFGQDQKYVFPWLAVPAEGQKDFFCPDNHIYEAQSFIHDCRNFLFIGFSGLDSHVLELFNGISNANRLMVIGANREDARKIYRRLPHGMLPLKFDDENPCLFDQGFSAFVESQQFDKFLSA